METCVEYINLTKPKSKTELKNNKGGLYTWIKKTIGLSGMSKLIEAANVFV